MQILNDLSFFRSLALMFFLVFEIVFDHLTKIDKRLPGDQLLCESIIKPRQNFFFYLS